MNPSGSKTPDQNYIRQLISSYPELNGASYPSSFILLNDKGIATCSVFKAACHWQLRTQPIGYHQELLTAVPKKDDLSISYLQFLIEGPFRQFKDMIHLNTTDGGEYYLHVTDLDKFPADVFFDFCIASRAPIEFRPTLNLWSSLKNLGLSPGLAMCVAGLADLPRYLCYGPPTSLDHIMEVSGPPSFGHWWFDMSCDWSNLIKGTPQISAKPYKLRPSDCTPCNAIWHSEQSPEDTINLFNKPLKELVEMFDA